MQKFVPNDFFLAGIFNFASDGDNLHEPGSKGIRKFRKCDPLIFSKLLRFCITEMETCIILMAKF